MIRYLNPADYHSARITKAGKDFAKRLDFKDIQFPVKTRNIHKIEKSNSINISTHVYENKQNIQSMYQNNDSKKHYVDLLLIEE